MPGAEDIALPGQGDYDEGEVMRTQLDTQDPGLRRDTSNALNKQSANVLMFVSELLSAGEGRGGASGISLNNMFEAARPTLSRAHGAKVFYHLASLRFDYCESECWRFRVWCPIPALCGAFTSFKFKINVYPPFCACTPFPMN